MKLKHFEQQEAYRFVLTFENDYSKVTDLQGLIGKYVNVESLHTAYIDSEWGCLEFLNGKVDIDPKTLYRYANGFIDQQAA